MGETNPRIDHRGRAVALARLHRRLDQFDAVARPVTCRQSRAEARAFSRRPPSAPTAAEVDR